MGLKYEVGIMALYCRVVGKMGVGILGVGIMGRHLMQVRSHIVMYFNHLKAELIFSFKNSPDVP